MWRQWGWLCLCAWLGSAAAQTGSPHRLPVDSPSSYQVGLVHTRYETALRTWRLADSPSYELGLLYTRYEAAVKAWSRAERPWQELARLDLPAQVVNATSGPSHRARQIARAAAEATTAFLFVMGLFLSLRAAGLNEWLALCLALAWGTQRFQPVVSGAQCADT